MKRIRWLALMLAISMWMLTMGGAALAESADAAQARQTGALGQVTKIDANEITIALGAMPGPGGQGGGAPSGEAPSGNPPSGASGDPGGLSLTLTGETLTFTASDSTAITVNSMQGSSQGTFSDIAVGGIVTVEVADGVATSIAVGMPMMGAGGENGGAPDGQGGESAADLTGAYAVDGATETSNGQSISSKAGDENAVLVENGGNLTLTGATVTKTGDTSSADQSNFAGLNAIVAVTSGSTATLSGGSLTSDSEGSNAVFATGDGSTANVENVTISTTGNSSRGLDATYNGTVNARNVTISTTGAHCATLATDRGEGTITVDGATLSASGDGSPIIYSTGNITGANLTGTATGSQMMVVEGKNSITVSNSDLTGAGLNGIMLYQSTSGDAAEGVATLSATGCKLTTTSEGPFFYVTNTQAEAALSDNVITYSSGILAQVSGNSTNNWGTPGENGGVFTLTGAGQVLAGDVAVDGISTFALSLTRGSIYTGSVDAKNEGKSVRVSLDGDSSWTMTGDSHVDALTDVKADLSNIQSGGFTLYYDAANEASAWLGGATVPLAGGGSLTPEAAA